MTVTLTVPEFYDDPHLMTADDFLALDVDPKLHLELIDGELILTPAPMAWHNEVASELRNMLKPQIGDELRAYTDLDVRLDEEKVVRPDVIVATRAALRETRAHRVEEVRLVVEIESRGSKLNDRWLKPVLYREAGVEYWRIERRGDDLVLHQDDGTVGQGVHEVTLRHGGLKLRIDLVELASWMVLDFVHGDEEAIMTVTLTVPEFYDDPHLMTADDFLALDVDPKLHLELIDGELILTPAPTPWHQRIAFRLTHVIESQLDEAHEAFPDTDVRLNSERVLRPDVLVATRAAYDEERPLEAADVRLVIELVSPGSVFHDRRVKPIVYGEAGLEYWRIERKDNDLILYDDEGKVSTGTHEAVLRNSGLRLRIDLVELATWLPNAR